MSAKERLDLINAINELLVELEEDAVIAEEVGDELNGNN
jgi:hypothetical protein